VASTERRVTLRREILDARAPQVITLGQEALDAVLAVADEAVGVQTALAPGGYGRVGELRLGEERLAFGPLVHPGFLRQALTARRGRLLARGSRRSVGFTRAD